MQNKKPWIKPRKLPFGALGFSFTGTLHGGPNVERAPGVSQLLVRRGGG